MKKSLVLATYNIQFSLNPEKIINNVVTMVNSGVDVFCFQEVVHLSDKAFIVDILIKKLGSDWKAIYNLGSEKSRLGMGNCIIWNTKKLSLTKEQNVFLPKKNAYAPHEKAFTWIAGGITVPFQRRTIIGYFLFNNKKIRITNVHLDHNGGLRNRKRQLEYLIKILKKNNNIDQEIVCGDFNSFDFLKTGKELKMQKDVLGESFVDVSKNNGWTADINNSDIKIAGAFFKFVVQKLHIHIRRKLDYIWVRGMLCSKCEKLYLTGSDHKPLVAHLYS